MSGTYAGFSGVGRLTRDSELKYTNGGQAVCHFSIVTDGKEKKGDAWVDVPSFWDVDLWGKQGESVAQYLTKGKLVHIVGPVKIEQWEQDGQKRQKVKISASHVTLLSGGEKHDQADQPNKPASNGEFQDDLPPF